MVSEFGNWGLPTLKDLLTDYGEEPSGSGRAWTSRQPHGVQRRFDRYHLDEIFGSYDQFAIATQWHQYYALKYEIEEMRKYREHRRLRDHGVHGPALGSERAAEHLARRRCSTTTWRSSSSRTSSSPAGSG